MKMDFPRTQIYRAAIFVFIYDCMSHSVYGGRLLNLPRFYSHYFNLAHMFVLAKVHIFETMADEIVELGEKASHTSNFMPVPRKRYCLFYWAQTSPFINANNFSIVFFTSSSVFTFYAIFNGGFLFLISVSPMLLIVFTPISRQMTNEGELKSWWLCKRTLLFYIHIMLGLFFLLLFIFLYYSVMKKLLFLWKCTKVERRIIVQRLVLALQVCAKVLSRESLFIAKYEMPIYQFIKNIHQWRI